MGGRIDVVSKATAVSVGLALIWLIGASCIPGDGSGVGSIEKVLGSEYLIVGTVVRSDDQQVSLDVATVVPLADGLPDTVAGEGEIIEIPIDASLGDVETGQEYAFFLQWTGEFLPSLFGYDIKASSFMVAGSEYRSDNGSSLEEVVECLDEQFSTEVTGNEHVDAVVELVKRERVVRMGDFPEALTDCAWS